MNGTRRAPGNVAVPSTTTLRLASELRGNRKQEAEHGRPAERSSHD